MPVQLGRAHVSLAVALALAGGVALTALTPSDAYDKTAATAAPALVIETALAVETPAAAPGTASATPTPAPAQTPASGDGANEVSLAAYKQQQAEAAAAAAAAQAAAAQAAAEEAARAEAAQRAARDAVRNAVADPRGAARALMGEYGWNDSQFGCLDRLWQKESNWNHQARNRSSGAFGIPQALPGSKMAAAGADWQTNPLTQIRWGLDYIQGRYGSPCAAWSHSQSRNWY